MQIERLYEIFTRYPSVQTDSRQLKENDLFFALKGAHFNGNLYAQQALQKGAAYAIIDDAAYAVDGKTILVEDVLQTLQQLALFHRRQFRIPVLAITGSNGKTTTKELVHGVISTRFRTYTTKGNLNNHIGIPLTLLRIGKDAEFAIVEMGANHQREIASYCSYTEPTHGLITNCGKAHLEGFGGVEGVRKGKGELFDYLRAHIGTAFIMEDYDYLVEMSKGIREIIPYGTRSGLVRGTLLQSSPFLSASIQHQNGEFTVSTQLVGDYNLPNILAAAAVGRYFGVADPQIQMALQSYTPSNSRSQLIEKEGVQIILDAYNANPTSMRAAIENFAKLKADDKILILGAMAEMGTESLQEHNAIIDLIGQYQWKEVVLVGGDFLNIPSPYRCFPDAEAAAGWYRQQNMKGCSLLIKGSRSMQMEKVIS